jgi:hypothetical protein
MRKDNPKEIFYEFFKIVREQNILFELSFPPPSKIFIFAQKDFGFLSPD